MSIVANSIVSMLIVLLGAFGRPGTSLIRGHPMPRQLVGRQQRPGLVRLLLGRMYHWSQHKQCTQAVLAVLILALGLLAARVDCTRVPEVQNMPEVNHPEVIDLTGLEAVHAGTQL